jgi:hypothetical protein
VPEEPRSRLGAALCRPAAAGSIVPGTRGQNEIELHAGGEMSHEPSIPSFLAPRSLGPLGDSQGTQQDVLLLKRMVTEVLVSIFVYFLSFPFSLEIFLLFFHKEPAIQPRVDI